MRDPDTPFQGPGRSDVFASQALCATSHPAAALAAVETMRAGGNAVDAGLAAAALLCVGEPMMTGLGGDAWAMYAPPGASLSDATPPVAMNASGRAPRALDVAELRARIGDAEHYPIPANSAHSVTVPTAVAGLCALHAAHGALALERVFAPAIAAAEDGLPIAPRAHFDWTRNADALVGVARDYFLDQGRTPRLGSKFRAPKTAEILRRVAAEGPSAFYEGEIAEDMVASLRALGGAHTLDDFAAAAADFPAPVSTVYRGATLWTPPPNGQGVVAQLILDILSRFDLSDLAPFSVDRLHLEAEAVSRAYAARDAYLAEAAAEADPTAALKDPALAARLAAEIYPERATDPGPLGARRTGGDTVQISVVDAEGGALSLIMSIFGTFGSGLASEKFGVLFHNRGGGFTLKDGHPNVAAPGKRPFHTLIPALTSENAAPRMAFGVMGGQYQAAGVARLLSNLLDFRLGLQDAVDAPRSFAYRGRLELEAGFAQETVDALAERGDAVARAAGPIGGAQAAAIDSELGVIRGASDPRKDGCALGY